MGLNYGLFMVILLNYGMIHLQLGHSSSHYSIVYTYLYIYKINKYIIYI